MRCNLVGAFAMRRAYQNEAFALLLLRLQIVQKRGFQWEFFDVNIEVMGGAFLGMGDATGEPRNNRDNVERILLYKTAGSIRQTNPFERVFHPGQRKLSECAG